MKSPFIAMLMLASAFWNRWVLGNVSLVSDKGVERSRGIANKKRGKYKRAR